MIIRNIEVKYNPFKAEDAGKFERAEKTIAKAPEILKQDLSLETKIIKVCETVYKCIDNIFGKGTHKKLLEADQINDVKEAIALWQEISLEINEAASEEAKAFITAVNEHTDEATTEND